MVSVVERSTSPHSWLSFFLSSALQKTGKITGEIDRYIGIHEG
jgi:hypothetical protein